MGDGAQCEPWVNLPQIGEVNRALNALLLEVDEKIQEDIKIKIRVAFHAIWAEGYKEVDEVHGTLGRTSELLTKTANALKGEPDPLSMHNWADLPEVAAKLKRICDNELEDRERRRLYCLNECPKALARATERAVKAEACCKEDLSHPTYPEMVAQVEKLTKERDEARAYGERLYQGALSRKVTCVYCGHEYPDGTPASQDQQLTEHIKVCEKHPMRKLEQFKILVHKQLDEWGVPSDPNPKIVCRVEARFAWLEKHLDFEWKLKPDA